MRPLNEAIQSMNKSHSLLLAAAAAVAMFTSNASANTPCPPAAASTEVKPYPVKVVSPTNLPRSFVKSTVEVVLTLDEQGVPTNVQTVGRVDRSVAAKLVAAVSQWRFAPKYVDGKPVAGQFVLPIELRAVEGA